MNNTQQTKTTYRVKDMIGGWTSLPHSTIEEGKTDLIRMRDRVGMVEWKSRPPHNYVLVEEQVVTTHTIVPIT
jgi:hypothetical protein